MNNRRKVIGVIPVLDSKEANQISVEVYYTAGGHNFFSGTNMQRGYVLSVTPQVYTDNGRYSTTQTSPLSQGCKRTFAKANRFGKKKLETLMPSAKDLRDLLEHEVYRAELKLPHSIEHYITEILGAEALAA